MFNVHDSMLRFNNAWEKVRKWERETITYVIFDDSFGINAADMCKLNLLENSVYFIDDSLPYIVYLISMEYHCVYSLYF